MDLHVHASKLADGGAKACRSFMQGPKRLHTQRTESTSVSNATSFSCLMNGQESFKLATLISRSIWIEVA
jgi:hypothetical protein